MKKQEELNVRLKQAAELGDVAALTQALEDGAHAKADESRALRLAAACGHVECVKLLVPVSDPKAGGKKRGLRALTLAASNGHSEGVRLLIAVSDPLADDSLALRWAAYKGRADCVALLLPASDPLAVGDGALDAAGLARSQGHAQVAGMIEAFIEARALSGATKNPKSSPRVKSAL
jgi:ankyrin repeat protein